MQPFLYFFTHALTAMFYDLLPHVVLAGQYHLQKQLFKGAVETAASVNGILKGHLFFLSKTGMTF